MKKYLIGSVEIKRGQKLWSILDGEVSVINILQGDTYPIKTERATYTLDGKLSINDKYPALYLSNPLEHNVPEYPKWMEVTSPGNNVWLKRYVLCEQDGKFVSIASASSNKSDYIDINTSTTIVRWSYARDLPIVKTLELTIDEIAAKFGVEVDQIKIKK